MSKIVESENVFHAWERTKGRIHRNNYENLQCGPSFEGKTSSVLLMAPMHAQRIFELEVDLKDTFHSTIFDIPMRPVREEQRRRRRCARIIRNR